MDLPSTKPIYLDYAATTPVDPRVVQQMVPYLYEQFGNPASRSHAYGWAAEEAVEIAREHVAALIGADPREIVWTSGATESNNLAIKGAAQFHQAKGKHLDHAEDRAQGGARHDARAGARGLRGHLPRRAWATACVDLEVLKAALRPDTILVSVMYVNNEIGVIQDIPAIGALCRCARHPVARRRGAGQRQGGDRPGHAAGRPDEPVGAQDLRAQGHRRAVRAAQAARAHRGADPRRRPRARHALGHAAHAPDRRHGRGLPAGARVHGHARTNASARCATACSPALQAIPEVRVNGDLEQRVPHNLNISFQFVEGESLLMGMKGIAVSSGSACTSASLEPSYVLRALGLSDEIAHSSIRFSVGRFTTEAEIDRAVAQVKGTVERLRALSPLWDMHQAGIDLASIQWAEH